MSVNARNYFGRKVSVNARKLKRWVILPFLSNIRMSPKIFCPRYFAWLLDYTKRLISYSSFPISFLCLISLFFPCTYTATLHFLLWLSQRNKTQETLLLPFPTGPCKSEICTLLYSFSLKERARKLSWFFLSKPTVNTSKERWSFISFLLHILSKEPENSLKLSTILSWVVLCLFFPSRNINLVRALTTLLLESMFSFK